MEQAHSEDVHITNNPLDKTQLNKVKTPRKKLQHDASAIGSETLCQCIYKGTQLLGLNTNNSAQYQIPRFGTYSSCAATVLLSG